MSFDAIEFESRLRGIISSPAQVCLLFPQELSEPGEWAQFSIEKAQVGIAALLSVPAEQRTYANTVRAFDSVEGLFGQVRLIIRIYQMISPDANIRAACTTALDQLQAAAIDLFKNKAIYSAYTEYEKSAFTKEHLTSEERFFFKEKMRNFTCAGYELSDASFEQLKAYEKESAKLESDFLNAIVADTSFILVEEADLIGVDPVFVAAQERVAGKIKLTCTNQTRAAVIEHCQTAAVRQELSRAFNTRACPGNIGRLEKLLEVRENIAQLLGFASYAHLSLSTEMAETPERVHAFLDEIIKVSTKKAENELAVLLRELPAGVELVGNKLAWCDYAYVRSCYIKKHFNIDSRSIAEYFPIEAVLDGIFSIYQDFLNISFAKESFVGAWDDSVRMLSVSTKDGKQRLGYILLDIFPRKNKFGQALQETIVPSLKDLEGYQSVQVSLVLADFPQELPGKPALLTHENVATFFHEFGHAMHALLGRTSLYGTAGTAVKWDFVEMPSQIFEEWMWDRGLLKQISKHYQTGRQMPDEMIDMLLHLRTFGSGYAFLNQSYYATLSLAFHGSGSRKDTTHILDTVGKRLFTMLAVQDRGPFQASFGHLGPYAARYYGYLWSKVFALDLFEKIRKEGLRNRAMGQEFIEKVLGKGGSDDPNKLLQEFLGRAPNQDAFLKGMGLL